MFAIIGATIFGSIAALVGGTVIQCIRHDPYRTTRPARQHYALVPAPAWTLASLEELGFTVVTKH